MDIFKKCLCVLVSGSVLLLAGCGNEDSGSSTAHVKAVHEAFEADTEQVPDIVFMKKTTYNQAYSENMEYQLNFFDKSGRYYVSDNTSLGGLSPEDIVKEFQNGTLLNVIQLTGKSCDMDVLSENFMKFCSVCSDEDYSIEYYDVDDSAESDLVTWYGFSYDTDGRLRHVVLHDYYSGTEFSSNNQTAEEVFKWFSKAIKS